MASSAWGSLYQKERAQIVRNVKEASTPVEDFQSSWPKPKDTADPF